MSGLVSGCKTVYGGSNPPGTSKINDALLAQLVEQLTLISGSRVRIPEGVLQKTSLLEYNKLVFYFY